MSRASAPVSLDKLQADLHLTALVNLDAQKRAMPENGHWLPIGGDAYLANLFTILDAPHAVLRQGEVGGIGFLQPVVPSGDGRSTDTRTTLHMGLLLALLKHPYKRETEFIPLRLALQPLLGLLLEPSIGIPQIKSAISDIKAFRQSLAELSDSLLPKRALTEPQAVMARVILNMMKPVQADINNLGWIKKNMLNSMANLQPLIDRYQDLIRLPVVEAPVVDAPVVEAKEGGASAAVLVEPESPVVPPLPPSVAAAVTPVTLEEPAAHPSPPSSLPPPPRAVLASVDEVPREAIIATLVAKLQKYQRVRLDDAGDRHLPRRFALFQQKGFSKMVKVGAARYLIQAIRGDVGITNAARPGGFDYRLTCAALCQGKLYRDICNGLPKDVRDILESRGTPEAKVELIIQTCRAEAAPRDEAGDADTAAAAPLVGPV
ncbi:MAG: hypothetical protein P1U63_07045 [Coxiellaceae bacterium]|nr:hypothetical protein [Coxiellaceae bacterium]